VRKGQPVKIPSLLSSPSHGFSIRLAPYLGEFVKKRGFSLIEIVIALGLLAGVILYVFNVEGRINDMTRETDLNFQSQILMIEISQILADEVNCEAIFKEQKAKKAKSNVILKVEGNEIDGYEEIVFYDSQSKHRFFQNLTFEGIEARITKQVKNEQYAAQFKVDFKFGNKTTSKYLDGFIFVDAPADPGDAEIESCRTKASLSSGRTEIPPMTNYLVIHEMSFESPDCPQGWYEVSKGYSFVDNGVNSIDLSTPSSCKEIPEHADIVYSTGKGLHKDDPKEKFAAYGHSLFLRNVYDKPNMLKVSVKNQLAGKGVDVKTQRTRLSQCTVCEKQASVTTIHSGMVQLPPCPIGWKRLWGGFSYMNAGHTSGSGSCLKRFSVEPFMRAWLDVTLTRWTQWDYLRPSHWVIGNSQGFEELEFYHNNQKYVSHCSVCEMVGFEDDAKVEN
jgi:prepilin-type N-terminal cleavage/methylation domain-containing protein